MLRFTPSVQVRYKGRRNATGITLRGSGNVNVLLDGMDLTADSDYRFVHFLPASLLQEVRVVRDSTSLIYGPPQLTGPNGITSFGGVVDFRLLDPTPEPHGELGLELGSYGANTQHAHATGSLAESLGYVLSLDRNAYDGPGGETMGHEFRHGLAKLVWTYWDASTLTGTVLYEDSTRQMQQAEGYSIFAPREEEYDPWRSTSTMLRLNHVWNEDSSTTLEAYYRDFEATLVEHHANDREFTRREYKWGVHARQTLRSAERNTLRVGAHLSRWETPTGKLHYANWKQVKGVWQPVGSPRREWQWSAYAQDEWEAVPGRLTLDVGGRVDQTYVEAGYSATGPAFGEQTMVGVEIEPGWEDPAWSAAAGASLQVTERQVLTLRGAFTSDSGSDEYVTRTGSDLDAARELRLEAGYGVAWHRLLRTTLTAFYKDIRNGLAYAGRYDANPAPNAAEWVPFWEGRTTSWWGLRAGSRGHCSKA